jgi:hypothetical protein
MAILFARRTLPPLRRRSLRVGALAGRSWRPVVLACKRWQLAGRSWRRAALACKRRQPAGRSWRPAALARKRR